MHPLEVNGKWIEGWEGVASKEAYTVHITDIISR
jgi:hypothetical protein